LRYDCFMSKTNVNPVVVQYVDGAEVIVNFPKVPARYSKMSNKAIAREESVLFWAQMILLAPLILVAFVVSKLRVK